MHIFISYAKADARDLALQLRDAFTALPGVTAWMDTSLYSGEDWAVQIQDEIDRADLVVVLLSQDVNRLANHPKGRSFVLKEIHYAQQIKKIIIPVMAQPTRVPVQLAGIEYIDFTRDPSTAHQRLVHEIANRVGISMPSPARPVVASSSPTARPANSATYRRPIIIIGLVVLIVIVFAAIVLPALNRSSSATPTNKVVVLPSNTPIATVKPTDAPVPTSTATTSSTDIPTPTSTLTDVPIPTIVSSSLSQPSNPVTQNADWKPQYQTFNGFEMALVPVGCFMMGSNDGDTDEKPVNQQCFNQPFWIDRYEVTNQQYGSEGNFKGDKRPRDEVTWFQARDFCIQRGARLPTEREWEYASRGPSNLVYPWSNDFVPNNIVYSGNSNGQSADVGSRHNGDLWVGASDLSGNLWEWVSSLYQPYPYKTDDGRELDSDSTDVRRVLRGGSGLDYVSFVRASDRFDVVPTYDVSDVGFRCVRPY